MHAIFQNENVTISVLDKNKFKLRNIKKITDGLQTITIEGVRYFFIES